MYTTVNMPRTSAALKPTRGTKHHGRSVAEIEAELEEGRQKERQEQKLARRDVKEPPVIFRLTRARRAQALALADERDVSVNKLAETVFNEWIERKARAQ